MNNTDINQILSNCRAFFNSGKTRDVRSRIESLRALKRSILAHEQELYRALHHDLGKSDPESYMTEVSMVFSELDLHICKLRRWAAPHKVRTPLMLMPSRSRILHEPLGVALIIAPWNYPFQLLFSPLIGAISAGNTAILKPSEYIPSTNAVMRDIVSCALPEGHVAIVEGDHKVNTELLEKKFDYIFFTGSTSFGQAVMEAAAKHLTPVTLELGGKSPCIVGAEARMDITARRIVWGKLINAGQTCIAPDYVLVHNSRKDELLTALKVEITKAFGEAPHSNPQYPRIVSTHAMERLISCLDSGGSVVHGGRHNIRERYFEPTIILNPDPKSKLMSEEIFGPLLPVLEYKEIDQVIRFINQKPKPLALYYFGGKRQAGHILANTTSGGACINDTLVHIANHRLPFGGVGASGMGRYHGRLSFEIFSNPRALISSSKTIDIPIKYAPYKAIKFLKRFM